MAVDRHEVEKAIDVALTADGTVTGLIGNPPRVEMRVKRHLSFPFVRADTVEAPHWLRVMGAAPPTVRRFGWQFTAFDNRSNSQATVSDIQAAFFDVMNDRTNFTITGGTLVGTVPGLESGGWDEDTGTMSAAFEWFFIVQ
jgi:hypothetical protein